VPMAWRSWAGRGAQNFFKFHATLRKVGTQICVRPLKTMRFNQLTQWITAIPGLHMLPHFELPFTVSCDASNYGLRAMLLQEGRPIAFDSCKLERADMNKSPYEKELLAVIHALQVWSGVHCGDERPQPSDVPADAEGPLA